MDNDDKDDEVTVYS